MPIDKIKLKQQERHPLSLHQRKGFYYSRNVEHPAYCMEMRLGKTRLTIKDLIFENKFPVLIISPYSALYSWEYEFDLLSIPKSEIQFISNSGEVRRHTLRNNKFEKSFYLTNTESHLSCGLQLAQAPFKSIVLDESTTIKNPETECSYFYTKNFRGAKRRYILSGLPMPESELDIFQQLKFLDPSILGFKNFYEFKFYCFTKTFLYNWALLNRGKKLLSEKLAKYCFFMSRQEAGYLNRKIFERRIFTLNKEAKKSYDYLKKYLILNYQDKLIQAFDNSLAIYNKLRLICSGFIEVENLKFKMIDTGKMDILIELLTGELKNNKIIIYAEYNQEIIAIHKKLIELKLNYGIINGSINMQERDNINKNFQLDNLQIVICQPHCAKYGRNFNKADTTIYFSSPLGLETRKQTEDRMVDIYNNEADLYIDLTAEKTIEVIHINSLIRKESRYETIRSLIKHLQEE